jgi:hypothetical protein
LTHARRRDRHAETRPNRDVGCRHPARRLLQNQDGHKLRFLDGGGSILDIKMWNTTGYVLENDKPVGSLQGLTPEEIRAKLAAR